MKCTTLFIRNKYGTIGSLNTELSQPPNNCLGSCTNIYSNHLLKLLACWSTDQFIHSFIFAIKIPNLFYRHIGKEINLSHNIIIFLPFLLFNLSFLTTEDYASKVLAPASSNSDTIPDAIPFYNYVTHIMCLSRVYYNPLSPISVHIMHY